MKTLLAFALLLGSACNDTVITHMTGSLDGFISKGDIGTSGGKRVFVTSTGYTGAFTTTESLALGIADTRCQAAADAAGLGGSWVAWLSGDTTDAITRIVGQGPWARLDGIEVFKNRANLSTQPLAPINRDENNVARSLAYVWTGTENGGATAGMYYTCAGWTSATSYAIYGSTESVASWTHLGDDLCGYQYSLYCFEK